MLCSHEKEHNEVRIKFSEDTLNRKLIRESN